STSGDLTSRSVLMQPVLIGSEPAEVDITTAVRAALARGDTRLTIRIENLTGTKPVTLQLAGTNRTGGTGLQLTSATPSLLADLISADGPAVALGKSTIDLRTIEAGTYYLRVYNPTGESLTNLPFSLE